MRGTVNLIGESRQGIATRIQTLGPWTVTGEIGAFSGYRAPYSAIAERDGLLYRLSEENRKQMESENQELAAEFHRLIIIMIGNHLMKASRAVVNSINWADVVITDMTMPNMTGVQLSQKLLEIRPDIPVIICTGFSEKINYKKAKALGIRGYAMKPMVMGELADKIREVLESN